MKITKQNSIIKLTKEECENIIKKYLYNQGYTSLKGFKFDVQHNTWTEGYGHMERGYKETVFKGVTVEVEG